MSPGLATMSSPELVAVGDHGDSSPVSTVNVKLRLDRGPISPDDAAGRRISGDEVEEVSDNDDDVAEVANRNGKRKRPISVS